MRPPRLILEEVARVLQEEVFYGLPEPAPLVVELRELIEYLTKELPDNG
jgi:hypothetical protein